MSHPTPTSRVRAAGAALSLGSLGSLALLALAASLTACTDAGTPTAAASKSASVAAPSLSKDVDADDDATFVYDRDDDARHEYRDAKVRYGKAVRVGRGWARSYLLLDADRRDRRPLEIGVALSEDALDGLPAPAPMKMAGPVPGGLMQHGSMTDFDLPLPDRNPTQFRFVGLNWNPAGHEPPGIYDVPHFDFHFYTITPAQRDAIDPATDANYAAEAANLPPQQFGFPYYVDAATAAGGIPAALAAVPHMGLHWLDVRSPELQGALGNPAGYKPFTKTFIYGSWNGRYTFAEPMITRAYILAKRHAADPSVRNEVAAVSTAAHYQQPGFWPDAYRVAYDRKAGEYRVALTRLEWRD